MHVVVNASSARIGGALTYLRELLPRLQRLLASDGARLTVLLNSQVNESVVSGMRATGVHVSCEPWMGWPGYIRTGLEQLELPRLLGQLRASVILGVGDTIPLWSSVPSVVLCRNAMIYSSTLASARLRLLYGLARRSVHRATKVVAVSESLASVIRETTGRSDIAVVHHGPGLNLRPLAQPRQPWRLLSIGSLYRHKRVELAIEAVRELRRQGYRSRLDVVGAPVDRSYASELNQLVRRLGLRSDVLFLGSLGPGELEKRYAAAAALLVTSRYESFCHPILEGFSTRTPVVTTDDLNVAAEIGGEGVMAVRATGTALANAVVTLHHDHKARAALIAAARPRLSEFTWERTADGLLGVLNEAVRG